MMHSWHRLTLNGVCFPEYGYRDRPMWDYTEFIIVATITGVLLVFSVVGSVYVIRGHLVRCAQHTEITKTVCFNVEILLC